MCVQGNNLNVSLLRNQADLTKIARATSRKATVSETDLSKIKRQKRLIADSKKFLAEHQTWCKECMGM